MFVRRFVPSLFQLFLPRLLLLSFTCPLVQAADQVTDNLTDNVAQNDLIGEHHHYTVVGEDTLFLIARRFDIGITELLAANPDTDIWLPQPGKSLVIPTQHVLPQAPRQGIVINLAEMRLFYFAVNGAVQSFPIGIGREGWPTPTGATRVVKKRQNPTWIPTESIRQHNPNLPPLIPPGPDNPLGSHALTLDWPNYLIHGTNQPYGVGRRSSHGCIRLYPEDIVQLFEQVTVGTSVTVVDQPYKLGWRGDDLFLEAAPTRQQTDELLRHGSLTSVMPLSPALEKTLAQLEQQGVYLNRDAIAKTINERRGIPVRIGSKKGEPPLFITTVHKNPLSFFRRGFGRGR